MKVLTGQVEHVSIYATPVYPALQVQSFMEVLPSGEPALLGQLVQPIAHGNIYCPEGHATEHWPPLLPVYPVLQVQALMEVEPSGEPALLGQLEHSARPDEPLYWPGAHAEHS